MGNEHAGAPCASCCQWAYHVGERAKGDKTLREEPSNLGVTNTYRGIRIEGCIVTLLFLHFPHTLLGYLDGIGDVLERGARGSGCGFGCLFELIN